MDAGLKNEGISPPAEGTLASEKTAGIYIINILLEPNRGQSDLHKTRHIIGTGVISWASWNRLIMDCV
jgi:hypothetical protein